MRPYEISVSDAPCGFGWNIEVNGEVIARSHGLAFASAQEANIAAKQWAQRHQEMGYELRKEWWA